MERECVVTSHPCRILSLMNFAVQLWFTCKPSPWEEPMPYLGGILGTNRAFVRGPTHLTRAFGGLTRTMRCPTTAAHGLTAAAAGISTSACRLNKTVARPAHPPMMGPTTTPQRATRPTQARQHKNPIDQEIDVRHRPIGFARKGKPRPGLRYSRNPRIHRNP